LDRQLLENKKNKARGAEVEIWNTGSGSTIKFCEMIVFINSHIKAGEKIFIGSDSQLSSSSCRFATAICLYTKSSGGIYFFKKHTVKNKKLLNLKLRMLEEAQRTLETAFKILEKSPEADIELHLDIGMSEKSKTRKYVDELRGWILSSGFECKVKPNAWASASIADKHSKY